MNEHFDNNTPIVMLTVGQLKEILNIQERQPEETSRPTEYVYGLRGIRQLFDVSHATAQRYKDTIIKEAVSQNGRKIIVDAEKAIKLFNKKDL